MPRTELRYTYIAKGKYWRFRHPVTGDCPLPGTPEDAAFMTKYGELLAKVQNKPTPADPASWSAMIDNYLASAEFAQLAESTQDDYQGSLDTLREELGDQPFLLTTRKMVKAVRDDFKDTPRKAQKLQTMASGLYSWADQAELIPEGFNPVKGLKKLRNPGETEYTCWSEFEFDIFAGAAIEPMHVAVMLARFTGQRASDIARMTWKQFQGDMIRVRQVKTKALLDIACPATLQAFLSAYKAQLDRDKKRGVMILTNVAGRPYNANSLSSAIGREVAKIAAGTAFPSDRSIHGLRYMAGAELEECGCTVAQIMSVLGHHAYKMAMKYASQRLRAREAAAKRDASS